MVPVSVIDEGEKLEADLAGHPDRRPRGRAARWGRSSALVRLHQVWYSFQAHAATGEGEGVAADRLAGIAGFAPTTFHAVGSRVAAEPGAPRLRAGA